MCQVLRKTVRRKRPLAVPISSRPVSWMRTPGRPFSRHHFEHRLDAELVGALALQRYLGDGTLDDLKAEHTVLDVLYRDDRPAEVKPFGAIDIADGGRHVGEVGLRH